MEVETLCGGGEVGVGFYGEGDIAEDLVVVGPCWTGEVDGLGLGARIEFGEEEGAEMHRARAGDSLEGAYLLVGVSGRDRDVFGGFGEEDKRAEGGEGYAYSFFFYGRTVGAEDELLCGRGEVGEAGDGQVLVVEIGVGAEALFGLKERSIKNSRY